MIYLTPKGKYNSVQAINDTIIGTAADGSPVYLRDMAIVSRGYQSPARYLNYYTGKNAAGELQRSRAITVAISMRDREKIAEFGRGIDERITALKTVLPPDLIMARTSDQPRQVKESIALFMDSLNEAIILVVIVSLIGFWEWRSALLMALSIPITLAMTFGMASILGVELQQVSVVSLILALGLLVDDPVVAGDAIKRSLADGHNNLIASWLGPTKLAKAILFATLTNIAAYLPFLMITGDTGTFLHSMPIVMTCSLVASRIVSMWFIPLLGYYILRSSNKPEPSMEERRTTGFTGFYARIAAWSIQHRWKVLIGSLPILLLGGILFINLKTLFFPDDVQYWSTVDIRLPNNATVESTRAVAIEAEKVIHDTALGFDRMDKHIKTDKAGLLHSITSFVGGGGPRFWMSISPELPQSNYAQIIILYKLYCIYTIYILYISYTV
jgi:multidrug efflux pump subunit AcrB